MMGTSVNHTTKTRVLSCGIVPIRRGPEGLHVLLLRAYNYWDFPKGMAHNGEVPLQAALRELEEETALQGARFEWGQDFFETRPYARGKVARYYVAELPDGDVVIRPNPISRAIEHHEFRWVTPHEARRLLVPRVAEVLDWAMKRINSSSLVTSKPGDRARF